MFEDLDRIGWSGNRTHLLNVRHQLSRVALGEVDYLAVRSPDGFPVCKGGIDYVPHPGAGAIFQLATLEALQSLGIGTRLIGEAERRIVERGLHRSIMGVGDENTRARRLYERLGYERYGETVESWEAEDDAGKVYMHRAAITLLAKTL